MSNATQSMNPQDNSSNRNNNYGILLYIIILVTIILISLISNIWIRMRLGARLGWCTESNQDQGQDSYESSDQGQDPTTSMENGVDEATLDGSYPKFLCSEAHKVVHGDEVGVSTASLCCSICLGEYKGNEMLRLLTDCGHLFHQMCIDPWLRVHPTCPVCRNYSVPNTPYQEPGNLPEVVLLVSRS